MNQPSTHVPTPPRWAALGLLLTMYGCGTSGGNGTPLPPPPPPPPPASSVTATVGGTAWQSVEVSASGTTAPDGDLTILAFGPGNTTLTLGFFAIPGPGTYPIGILTGVTGGWQQSWISPETSYGAPSTGRSGTVTFTTITSNRAVGTFTFLAEPTEPGPAPITISGAFDVRPEPAFTPLAPAGTERYLRMTVNGEPRNMVSASITCSQQTGCSFGAVDDEYSLLFRLPSSLTPGTYTIATDPKLDAFQIADLLGTELWRYTGGEAQVTIASYINGIVTGSFDATLPPSGLNPGAADLEVQSGLFQLRAGPSP